LTQCELLSSAGEEHSTRCGDDDPRRATFSMSAANQVRDVRFGAATK
jgi:hypothetical protein